VCCWRSASWPPALSRAERGFAPILLAVVEGRLVVAASDSAQAPVGAVVIAIEGDEGGP
jgi:hypothetical protein